MIKKKPTMYKLFSDRYEPIGSIIRPPGFELVRRMYSKEILKVVSYFNNRVHAVKSNHLLCRILTTASVSIEHSLSRYMEIVNARSPYVAKHFLLTSSITVGKTYDGIFYGPGNEEIIISDEDYFNPFEVGKDWRNIRAVKVIQHNCSDLSLLIPNGKEHYSESGVNVISINIPLLLLQYRGFLLEQNNKLDSGNLNTAHFVNMYVLPNMLYSHIELVIFNRMFNLTIGAPMGAGNGRYPFLIIDYSDRMDDVLKELIQRLKNNSYLYSTVLQHIPGMFVKDMSIALEVPDFGLTRQVWWACLTSRIRQMYFLLVLGGDKGIGMNRSLYNKGCIQLERLIKDPIYKSMLSIDNKYEYNWMINEILKNN